MDEHIRNLAVFALPILFAITMHHAAQAFAARRFGDNTAYAAGRASFNPLAHIDPVGTILIPVVFYVATGFVFGYAKPLPINYGQMRNPKRDMAWVALAGPAANFVMALIWALMSILLVYFGVGERFPHLVANAGIMTNIWLMAFYLLPIPPLDGGRIVFSLLPNKAAYKYARIEPYGLIILLVLYMTPLIGIWLGFFERFVGVLVALILYPLNFILT
jgi:Zn-dependent protease